MSQIKLQQILTEYLAKNKRLKWSTRDAVQRAWTKLMRATSKNIEEFDYREAEDFQEYLFNQGLAPGAVKSNIKMIRPVFNWAWRRGHREGDPFKGLKLPRIAKREIRVYSDAELLEMLASANLLWQARIVTAASAGLRKGEVLNLTVDDVDFAKGYIKVQAKRDTKYTWTWSPKNYECRRVPLSDQLNRLLVNILNELPDGQPYLLLSDRRYFGIQQLRAKGLLKERVMATPDENFRPFKRLMGNGTFHDLRRTCITRWTWTLPPQEVRKLAGHADIKTTLEYYSAIRADVLQRAQLTIGATGLEPATS